MPTEKKTEHEEEESAGAMQRTIVVMFALINGETNEVTFPIRPLFIRDGTIVSADDQGEADEPESAFHSDLFAEGDDGEGGHICQWKNGVKICPPH